MRLFLIPFSEIAASQVLPCGNRLLRFHASLLTPWRRGLHRCQRSEIRYQKRDGIGIIYVDFSFTGANLCVNLLAGKILGTVCLFISQGDATLKGGLGWNLPRPLPCEDFINP